MSSKDIKTWKKQLKRALLSMNVEVFKSFYTTWYQRGLYEKPLPKNDKVIEIAIRKMILQRNDMPKTAQDSAREWLLSHGCSLTTENVGD